MKKAILFSIVLSIAFLGNMALNAQTPVSGGIYSNTTWTLANSPYIVTSSVVVFPGVTLTIEPGVVIKFEDNQQLEIRQATLIAEGTKTDSIFFTSNSNSPHAGIWDELAINLSNNSRLNYCSFSYGHYTVHISSTYENTIYIKNSSFYKNDETIFIGGRCIMDSCNIYSNNWGIEGLSYSSVINYCNIFNNQYNGINIYERATIKNCHIGCNGQYGIENSSDSNILIENCSFDYNKVVGVASEYGGCKINNCNFFHNYYGVSGEGTVTNCLFQYNSFSLDCSAGVIKNNLFENDSIGIKIDSPVCTISCNTFQNNVFNAVYISSINSNCIINNYWGTTDSATIESLIYDGYDNVTYGLLSFIPFYTVPCSNVGSTAFSAPLGCSPVLAIDETLINQTDIAVYPNPATDILTLTATGLKDATIATVYDLRGQPVLQHNMQQARLTGGQAKEEINIGSLAPGVYIIKVCSGDGVGVRRFVKE